MQERWNGIELQDCAATPKAAAAAAQQQRSRLELQEIRKMRDKRAERWYDKNIK